MRLLVIAIASHGQVYDQFIEVFKSYMNSKPWIKSYLLFGDSDTFRVEKDEIHMPVIESWKPGILHKTIWAMKHLSATEEFDYLLRTNLSSFWLLDRLQSLLDTLPREKVAISNIEYPCIPGDVGILNGSGMILSRDVVEYLAKVGDWKYMEPDDREITRHVYFEYGAKLIHIPYYLWIAQTPEKIDLKENLSVLSESDCVQVRIRNPYHGDGYNNIQIRSQIDPVIHRELLIKYGGLFS